MSANSNNESDRNNHEGQVVAVDESSALQVETLGTNLATGGLQEQIESGDQSKELSRSRGTRICLKWGGAAGLARAIPDSKS